MPSHAKHINHVKTAYIEANSKQPGRDPPPSRPARLAYKLKRSDLTSAPGSSLLCVARPL